MKSPYVHSEAHRLSHFLWVFPVPRHLAGARVQVVAPHIVVDAAVPTSPRVLILQEADNPRRKLTEELDGEDKRYDGNSNSTCRGAENENTACRHFFASFPSPQLKSYIKLTNHVKHEVLYQEAQCHSTAKYECTC